MTDYLLEIPDVVGAALRVSALAAEHATNAELNRRLEPTVADAIVSGGFARHFVPERHGGTAGTFTDYVRAIAAVGEGDPSAAWVASIAATLGRMCAYLPVEGQRELWAEGPDQFIVGALMPGGQATPVDGGWQISGEWPYMSGIDFSDWALVCCAPDRGDRSEVRFFVIPRSSYASEETWFTVGMRGTGSNTIVVENIVVPNHRTFTRDELVAGRAPGADAACHQIPLKAVNGLSFAAPILGAARGALALWTASVREKAAVPSANRIQAGAGVSSQLVLARVAGEIDAAALLLERVAAQADSTIASELDVARAQRDCALAADVLVGAVNQLFRTSGTRAQSETGAFQRFWRDANAAGGHAVLQFEPAAQAYAGLVLDKGAPA
jgi:two-component flavin-dependent monooxygenase